MKKIGIITATVMMVASYAAADLAVGFQSAPPVLDGAAPITSYNAQLIWSASPAPAGNVDTSGLLAGEVALVIQAGGGPGIFDAAALQNGGFAFVFDDADVGGADINSGYLFARLFEGAVIAPGARYLQTSLAQLGPGLPVYTNPDDTKNPPVYTASILAAPTQIATDGFVVIPEPATIGLMGVAGLGMFLARKKARR